MNKVRVVIAISPDLYSMSLKLILAMAYNSENELFYMLFICLHFCGRYFRSMEKHSQIYPSLGDWYVFCAFISISFYFLCFILFLRLEDEGIDLLSLYFTFIFTRKF
jgi:phosphatidylglycerophosphate synthase